MKRFATAFLLLISAAALTHGAFAQSRQQPVARVRISPEILSHFASGVATSPALKSGTQSSIMLPLVAEDSEAYYVNDGNTTRWPGGDTLIDPQTGDPQTSQITGNPFIRFVNFQRFTLPRPEAKPVIDSLHLHFMIDTIVGTQFAILFTDQTVADFSNGTSHPIPNRSFKQVLMPTTKWHSGQDIDTMIRFKTTGSKPVINNNDTLGDNKGNFFVLFSTYNPGNKAVLVADSNFDQRDLDDNLDRSGFEALSFDANGTVGDGTIGYWGGRFYTDDSHTTTYFPNFVMAAYTHDASAGVNDAPNSASVLEQNYPNPVSKTTDISFTLPTTQTVSLTVLNALGQTVGTVVNGRVDAGPHTMSFDASNLANGMYYYKLQAGDYTATRTMVVAK
jgi:hypothetical protein